MDSCPRSRSFQHPDDPADERRDYLPELSLNFPQNPVDDVYLLASMCAA